MQFKKNLFDSPLTGAEATRRTELMADAFATYYLTHARGLSLNAKRLLPSQQSFFEVGDCSFDSDGHHGTPGQRLRSAAWSAGEAASARFVSMRQLPRGSTVSTRCTNAEYSLR